MQIHFGYDDDRPEMKRDDILDIIDILKHYF